MALDPITAALDIGGKLIDRIWPDPAQAAQAKLQLFQMQQTGELAQLTATTDLAKAQDAIDQAEAASADPLQHWRGGAGWVCVAGLGYNFLIMPLGNAVFTACGHGAPFPHLDSAELDTLLTGMLGLGAYHAAQAGAFDNLPLPFRNMPKK